MGSAVKWARLYVTLVAGPSHVANTPLLGTSSMSEAVVGAFHYLTRIQRVKLNRGVSAIPLLIKILRLTQLIKACASST
eukprot:68801-Hanusia_phi.AAC.2